MAAPRRRPVWTRLRKGSGGTVTALAAAPVGSGCSVALAGTISGLFISRDNGMTWDRATGGLGAPYVQAAAISPNVDADQTMLVGTVDASASISVDNGVSWRDTTFWGTTTSVTSVDFSPQFTEDRLAIGGTADSGVIVSDNLGRTWNAQNTGLDDLQVLAVAVSPGPQGEERVLAGTASGLYTRARGSAEWRLANDCAQGHPIQVIKFVVQEAAYTAFAGTEGAGLYSTTTNGLTWRHLSGAGGSSTVNAIAISPNYVRDGTVVIATTEAGVLRTTDRGETWDSVGQDIDGPSILALTVTDAADGWALLAGLYEGGVWRSEDRGETWQRSDEGLASQPLISLAASPKFADDNTLIAGTAAEGMLLSTDAGRTWSLPVEAAEELTIPAIAFSPDFEVDRHVLGIAGQRVQQSTDAGQRWADVAGLPDNLSPTSLAAGAGGRRAVGTNAGALYLSNNAGNAWNRTSEQFQGGRIVSVAYSPKVESDGTLFASVAADGRIQLYHSRDDGLTWVRVLEEAGRGAVAPIAIPSNYRASSAFFGVVVGRDVYTPAGPRLAAWLEGRVSVEWHALVTSLVASPRFGRTGRFYAGTGLGLFQSDDRGHTWGLTGGRDAPTGVTCATVVTESSGAEAVYVGTLDGDVWRRGPRDEAS